MGLHDIRLSDVIDCIFPMIEGGSVRAKGDYKSRRDAARAECENLVAGLPSNEEQLKEHLESVEKLVEKEQSRRTSVDARLMSVVGLTSIAATVVLTALFAMAAGTMPLSQGAAKWTLVLGCFYLALQLYAALHTAIKGLSRASYVGETASNLLPAAKLAYSIFLRRRISDKLNLLEQHREVNNEKVSRMAVAHRAILNFLAALVLLAAAASWMALNRESPKEAVVCGELLTKLCTVQATPPRKIVLTRIATVGPFPDGDHLLDREAVLSCVREALKPYSDLQFSGWQIIGRADKRQLRADRAAIYGSNQALAMARAAWVTDNVLSRLPSFNPANAVVSVGGAKSIGAKVGDTDLQVDRAVDIYVLLDQEIKLATLDKSPAVSSAILCPTSKVIAR